MSVEAKLSSMSISHPTFSEIFDNVPVKRLRELIESDSGPIEGKTVKKTALKKMIQKSISDVAVRSLADALKKEQLAEAIAPLNINHEAAHNNPNSKRVLYKRFLENVSEVGIAAYMIEHVEIDLAKAFCEAIGIKATGKTVEALAQQLASHLEHEAVVAYWESFDLNTLHDVAFDMKLEAPETETTSKQVLIEAIINNESVAKLEKRRPKTEPLKLNPSKNKPSKIADGVSFDDLHYWWGVQELKEWCKERKVMTSGNKQELINRILAFLAGDKENTLAKEPSERVRKPRKKSEETKKRLAKAKRNAEKKAAGETTTATKKKAPAAKPKTETPKPAKAESKTKPAEKATPAPEPVEEEKAPEDLDLDNLELYTIAQLKAYCVEEEISIDGLKSKKDYIAAIEEYNADDEEGEEEEDN